MLFVFLLLCFPLPSIQILGYFGDVQEKDLYASRCTRKSKDVPACIHKYLEKDFISLSPIVYPKDSSSDTYCISSEMYPKKHPVLMDGPTLQNSCNDLYHVHDCIFDELQYCRDLSNFFQLRHLQYSLKTVLLWLCGNQDHSKIDENQHASVRTRFLSLLESVKCIECVRVNHRGCIGSQRQPEDELSLWHKVLRLEIGMERCDHIKRKMECLQTNPGLVRTCGQKAGEIHKNLTDLFLTTWCDSAPFTVSSSNIFFSYPSSIILTTIFLRSRLTFT